MGLASPVAFARSSRFELDTSDSFSSIVKVLLTVPRFFMALMEVEPFPDDGGIGRAERLAPFEAIV